jgi:hypothetical protein
MTDWDSLQSMTKEVEAAAQTAMANGNKSQPADAHMQMRWALLLQDQVRQVQLHVQREQAECSRLHSANAKLRKELEEKQPDHPLLALAPASAPLLPAAASSTSDAAAPAVAEGAPAVAAGATSGSGLVGCSCGVGVLPTRTVEPEEQAPPTQSAHVARRAVTEAWVRGRIPHGRR